MGDPLKYYPFFPPRRPSNVVPVTVDNATIFGSNGASPLDFTYTLGSGATCIVVCLQTNSGQQPSAVTWDPTGANLNFDEITNAAQNIAGGGAERQRVWALAGSGLGSGALTLRLTTGGSYRIEALVSSYFNTALTTADAVPNAAAFSAQSSGTAGTWIVTAVSGEDISFSANKIGLIFNNSANNVASSNTWTPSATLSSSFRGTGMLHTATSPITLLIDPSSDDNLSGAFVEICPAT